MLDQPFIAAEERGSHLQDRLVAVSGSERFRRIQGPGFLEPVYQECLEIELELRGIPFRSKPPLTLTYKKRVLKQTYEPDVTCFEKVIVEIKAVSELIDDHRAQAPIYLKATGYRLALLVNFGARRQLDYERIVR
jgi:GxxExxY protein